MVTADVPPEINIDINGLIDVAGKCLYAQELQLILTVMILGLVIVLTMLGGAKK